MKTLRQFLASEDACFTSDDLLIMSKKLGIELNGCPLKDQRGHSINKKKGTIIITQFQIQFGLDEEF